MPDPSRSPFRDARPEGSSGTPPTWFDDEARQGEGAGEAIRRLMRRSRASWRLWVVLSLALGAGLTIRRARTRPSYGVSVVLLVHDTALRPLGDDLGLGALHTFVNDLAFTSEHLLQVMKRHMKAFPDAEKDPLSALGELREQMKVSIVQSDFIGDRLPEDPPQSAWITIHLNGAEPELTWTIAHELADLLITSTLAAQRSLLERELAGATAAVTHIEATIADLSKGADPTANDPPLARERARWAKAKEAEAAARLTLRVADEHRALFFEIVDPGRVPPLVTMTAVLVTTFFSTVMGAMVTLALLAGAFDPRVLDTEDLTSLGLPHLGDLPPLGAARHGVREGGSREARV